MVSPVDPVPVFDMHVGGDQLAVGHIEIFPEAGTSGIASGIPPFPCGFDGSYAIETDRRGG